MDISLKEASFEFQGNGGFARPSESGEQNSCRTVSERRASFLRTHTGSLVGQNGPGLGFPMCRGGLSRKPDHPRSHGDIGQPIDDDKRASSAVVFIIIENHWGTGANGHPCDFVEFQA